MELGLVAVIAKKRLRGGLESRRPMSISEECMKG